MKPKDPVEELLQKYAQKRMTGFEPRNVEDMWKRFEAAHLKRELPIGKWSGTVAACLAVILMAAYIAFPEQVRAVGQRIMDINLEFTGDRQANIGLSVTADGEPKDISADGEYKTLAQVQDVVPFPVLEPSYIPERFELVAYTYEPIGITGIVMARYRSAEGGFLTFEQFYFYDSDDFGKGKVVDTDDTRVIEVEINGATGVLSKRKKDGWVSLWWATKTASCEVYGHITPEEAQRIAESI